MIVIYFWYIVWCNLSVCFSGLNLIYLIPGGGTAAIAGNEDAYEYPEENTDLETYSPELTDPIPADFFDEPTKGFQKVGAFEHISRVSAESKDNGGSDVGNPSELSAKSISEGTTPLVFVSEKTDNSSAGTTKTSELTTDSETSTVCSDTSTKSTDIPTESIENETTPPPTFVSEQTDNSSAGTTKTSELTTDSETSTVCSDASTKFTDIPTESIEKETTPSPTFVSEQTNNSSETTTSETSTNFSDASTKSSDVLVVLITEETTLPSTSDLNTDSITSTSDLHTTELTTKPMTAVDQNHNNFESITPQATVSEQNLNESATNNATGFEEVVETSSNTISSQEDLFSLTKQPEETQVAVETSTEPVISNSSTYLEPTLSTRDSVEQLYNDLGETRSTFTPRYEEGYYDPKIAPTRYGQREEYVQTSSWKYASDYGIGMRDYNLILYAVNNSAVLEKGSLLNYVYFVFKEVLHVNMTLIDIRYCRYLRSKNIENLKKVPPVLVAFINMDVKNEILHKRKLLKPTGIKVEHDMPRKILDEQNSLLKPLMDKYRAMGQYVVVRSGKLLVEGKVLTQINLPDKYTYDPLQTFISYVITTVKTTTPGVELPREFIDYGFGADKKSGKKKKGGKAAAGGKKKRKPMIRIPLDEEVGDELSALILFTTKKFFF